MKKVVGAPGSGARAFLARRILAGKAPFPTPQGPLVVILPDADAVEDVADAVKALTPIFENRAESIAVFGDDHVARRTAEPVGRVPGERNVLVEPPSGEQFVVGAHRL